MLAVSPLRSGSSNDHDQIRDHGEMQGNFSILDDFSDINLDEFLVGFDEGDVLPELEVDPAEIFTDFSAQEDSNTSITMIEMEAMKTTVLASDEEDEKNEENELSFHGEEVVSEMRKEDQTVSSKSEKSRRSTSLENDQNRKSSSSSKGSQGKRKVKVSEC